LINKQMNPYLVSPWRFLDNLIRRGELQYIAEQFNITPQGVGNWTRKPNVEDKGFSGRRSPISYLFGLFDYFDEVDEPPQRTHQLAEYICVRAGGVFVPLPDDDQEDPDNEVLKNISDILKETYEALEADRKAWMEETPGHFTKIEKQCVIQEHLDAVQAHIRMIKLIERL
jgi:hypothetical protein